MGVTYETSFGVTYAGGEPGGPTWTVDATSDKGIPADETEWDDVMAAAGIASGSPNAAWMFNQVSGNSLDLIGAENLTAYDNVVYEATIPGWTTKGISSGAHLTSFYTWGGEGGTLGDADNEPVLALVYARVQGIGPGGDTTGILNLSGGASGRYASVNGTPVLQATGSGGQATATGAADPQGVVRPFLLKWDPTLGAEVYEVMSDDERLAPVATAPGGGIIYLSFGPDGQGTIGDTNVDILYAACWQGASAQLTVAECRTLLETLGWTVAW